MPLRNFYVQEPLFDQALLEGLLDLIFTVDDKEFLYLLGILAGQELAQILVIAMSAHASDHTHVSMNFMLQPRKSQPLLLRPLVDRPGIEARNSQRSEWYCGYSQYYC